MFLDSLLDTFSKLGHDLKKVICPAPYLTGELFV